MTVQLQSGGYKEVLEMSLCLQLEKSQTLNVRLFWQHNGSQTEWRDVGLVCHPHPMETAAAVPAVLEYTTTGTPARQDHRVPHPLTA